MAHALLSQSVVDTGSRNYSYLTYGFQIRKGSVDWENGTGFFIRTKSDTFFVTAKHVYNGCDGLIKDTSYPDLMSVSLENGMSAGIDIRDIKITKPCKYFYEEEDIIAIKTNFIGKYSIFLDSLMLDKPGLNNIFFSGYPRKEFYSWIKSSKPSTYVYSKFKIYENSEVYGIIDSLNYWIKTSDGEVNDSIKGCSGALVFTSDYDNNVGILGILVGLFHDDKMQTKGLVVCKIQRLYTLIENFKKTSLINPK